MFWFLRVCLKSKEPGTRRRALERLAHSRKEAAIPLLAAMLTDRDYSVRKQAIVGLGEMNQPRAVECIMSKLNSLEPGLFCQALEVIRKGRDARLIHRICEALPNAWRQFSRHSFVSPTTAIKALDDLDLGWPEKLDPDLAKDLRHTLLVLIQQGIERVEDKI
jgi:hypothetical protein